MAAKGARTGNYTAAEEEILARCWLEVSTDPIINNGQKKDAFWESITNSFNNCSGGTRTLTSLHNKWDVIRTTTLKFSAIYNKIEKSPPSGVVEADYLKLAKEKYYNENHHLFKMDLAWEVVRHHDKWKNHTGTAPKRKATQSPATSTTTGTNRETPMAGSVPSESPLPANTAPDDLEPPSSDIRPIGIKTAKQAERANELAKRKIDLLEKNSKEGVKRGQEMMRANDLQHQMNSIQLARAQTEKKRAQLEEHKLLGEREEREMKIMDKDLGSITNDISREYFLKKKRRILEALQQQELDEQHQQEVNLSKSQSVLDSDIFEDQEQSEFSHQLGGREYPNESGLETGRPSSPSGSLSFVDPSLDSL
ncbi:hypothetical protein MJO29_014509 [Puccinia striiformis f. sp. tritici]|nr:hypothetical protein MJO29_014509 [Puccinia striiformis f. sp. tritici]